MAPPLEVDDGDATIFEPQQTFLLQSLQALVGILPGDAGKCPDFFLRDLQMACEVRIENRIEQRSDRARQPRGRVQRAAIFQQPDELAEALVELSDQKRLNPTLFSNSPGMCCGSSSPDGYRATPRRRSAVVRS
jgi:hypothetical protein